ncbi:MAG TPA: LysR family transcriptional regulator [Gammaproteobacteria bacterium]|nr:LysR family transcriptional regulator [Gammaproteobacteria bacterium]
MARLNYNHLYYFWVTARTGTLRGAAERLHLTPQTLSTQIRQLEERLGEPLFLRERRGLRLTPAGEMARRYGDDMFQRASELERLIARGLIGSRRRVTVGIANVVPKLVAHRLLAVSEAQGASLHLVCREEGLERLAADLVAGHIDLVISDRPLGLVAPAEVDSTAVCRSPVALFATDDLSARFRSGLPASLGGAPLLLPSEDTSIRAAIENWFRRMDVRPDVVAEFDDSALMKTFGRDGAGLFPAPIIIADEVRHQFSAEPLLTLDGVEERIFLSLRHGREEDAAIVAIRQAGRRLAATAGATA